jgi:hypothetical protein
VQAGSRLRFDRYNRNPRTHGSELAFSGWLCRSSQYVSFEPRQWRTLALPGFLFNALNCHACSWRVQGLLGTAWN